MGSTGLGSLSKRRNKDTNEDNFGIKGAVAYKGSVPAESGLDKPSSNSVTLKYGKDKNTVLFQFKLTKDKEWMTITAFRNSIPEVKVKVKVDSHNPSLNQLLKSGGAEAVAATKIKRLMSESTQVSEGQLGAIAEKLMKKQEG